MALTARGRLCSKRIEKRAIKRLRKLKWEWWWKNAFIAASSYCWTD
jgi:hypothetical protein